MIGALVQAHGSLFGVLGSVSVALRFGRFFLLNPVAAVLSAAGGLLFYGVWRSTRRPRGR